MQFRNKKIIITASIVFALVLFVSVAFAALASNLNISFGNVTQNALTWNVGFKGSSVTPEQSGTSTTGLACGSATVTPSDVTISNSTLSKPGDKCTYPLVIRNSGEIAAVLSNITATEPTNESCQTINDSTMVCGNITYQLIDISGSSLSQDIIINKSEEYNIKLVVFYSGQELSETEVTQKNAKFTLTYTQSNNRTSDPAEGVNSIYKCKRATILHTEKCMRKYKNDNNTNNGCINLGYYEGGAKDTEIVTYGSFGTDGILSSGDAFDCDVNGDGEFDDENERFYYVSGLDGDETSPYAVMIYYNNVSEGVASSNVGIKYYTTSENWHGPENGYLQLPSTTQWPNVSLSNSTRQIYSIRGGTTTTGGNLPQFTYTDRAARFLSYKEINAGCDVILGSFVAGELDKCEYLMEHTWYVTDDSKLNLSYWWIENPAFNNSVSSYLIFGQTRAAGFEWTSYLRGVRPAIEVLKTDIDY